MRRNPNQLRRRAASRLAGLATLSLSILFASAAPASAATATDRPLLFSFDGHDTSAGPLVKPNKIAIDDSSGDLYISEGSVGPEWKLHEAVSKFNPDGSAAEFSAIGTSSLFGTPEERFEGNVSVAVDNSGGATQGRLYVLSGLKHNLSAFAPDGTFLWEIPDIGIHQPNRSDVTVDNAGHPWVLESNTVTEYANTGNPPFPIGSFPIPAEDFGIDLDANGNVFVGGFGGVEKYVGSAFDSILDPSGSFDVFADQSSATGHVFTSHGETGDFNEYDSGGSLLGTYGAGAIDVTRGIAYNPNLDRVYVANDGLNIIEAFGPPLTGTAPDPTIEASVVSGPGTATFHGTINPQGVANSYYFEWVDRSASHPFSNENGHFFRSPPQTLPADSSPHAVQYKATSVSGNTDWTVRLVALNSANGLRTVSGTDTFKPPKASANPTVTINAPSEVEPRSAHISGTINPKEDAAHWRVEYTTDPACNPIGGNSGWNKETIEYLPGGEVNTPLPVEYELEGLAASQEYCVRLHAFNSFGGDVFGEAKRFTTLALPASEISSAFAGPRTDTSARLNGRVNPEGSADFEYEFEWSEDGTTWQALEPRQSSIDAHEAIIVADQLGGLKPETTYHFRLAWAENETGRSENEAGPGGITDERTFTTRSGAEMNPPPRGIEMVNNPDKGNQNLFFGNFSEGPVGEVPYVSPNGEQARWAVTAGAPGSPSGEGGEFIAKRSPGGWHSQSLEPPALEQFAAGSLVYNLIVATPDQAQIVADLRTPGLRSTPESTLVRLDTEKHEEVLHTFKWAFEGGDELGGADITSDGAHVLTVDPETDEGSSAGQLVDIGAGGAPELVSEMPGGGKSTCGLGAKGGNGGFGSSFVNSPQWRPGYHMMATTDANLVYFLAKPNGECTKPLGLYVRDREAEETTLIDLAEGRNDEFIRATPDGSKAYFLTDSRLDPADENSDPDLYRWDQGSMEATCLTCVVPDADILSAGSPLSAVMVSDDFSHVYFESSKQLVAGEGIKGKENLYVLSGGTLRFVATPDGGNNRLLEAKNAKLSTDGNVLAFRASSAAAPRLTADPVQCGAGCTQVYRYEDSEGSVECVSCNPSGTTTEPSGPGEGGTGGEVGAFDLSGDGSTMGFVTAQSLTRLDVNGGLDVYGWRNGVLGLITDGVSEAQEGTAAPGVQGIDAGGTNVLFSVAQPGITGFELDRLTNLYDARIGGGFEPPGPPVHCSGDSCQGPLVAPPEAGHTASSGFSGYGNVKEGARSRSCAKRKVRRGGRCVKKHAHKKHKRHSHRASHANQGRSK